MSDYQWVPWALSGASLIWNLINSIATSKSQKNIKSNDRAIEEFRRLRTDIDSASAELGEQCALLRIIASGSGSLAEIRAAVKTQQDEAIPAYFKLGNTLRRASESSFAQGDDWQLPLDNGWDRFGDRLNGLYKPNISKDIAKKVINDATSLLEDGIKEIRKKLDGEMTRLFGNV